MTTAQDAAEGALRTSLIQGMHALITAHTAKASEAGVPESVLLKAVGDFLLSMLIFAEGRVQASHIFGLWQQAALTQELPPALAEALRKAGADAEIRPRVVANTQ